MINEVIIASACRTPIGSFLGTLSNTDVKNLGRIAGKEAIKRANISIDQIDEIVCGNVIQAGLGGNIGRQIQGAIGIPWDAAACTINQLCPSSMRAFEIGCLNIMHGKTEICLVVGVENMSMAPYLLSKGRTGFRMGHGTIEDAILIDGLVCSVEKYHMGITAENVAKEYNISREEQDKIAALSQERAVNAIKEGKFKDEIVPVNVQQRKQTKIFDTDEHPREGTNMETLAKLRPVFKKDGTVTAGNASGINDGSSAVIVMSSEKAKELGIKPLAKVVTTTTAGVDPAVMGLGPAKAIPKALKEASLNFNDIEYWEINEAFASQFIGVERMLIEEQGISFDMDIVNRNGSGISLGHPIGCTGLRIIVSLIYEMQKMNVRLGCASLCAGGGPAMATIISRE